MMGPRAGHAARDPFGIGGQRGLTLWKSVGNLVFPESFLKPAPAFFFEGPESAQIQESGSALAKKARVGG